MEAFTRPGRLDFFPGSHKRMALFQSLSSALQVKLRPMARELSVRYLRNFEDMHIPGCRDWILFVSVNRIKAFQTMSVE